MKPNIYLDIDGVLLVNEKFAAEGAEDFIKYCVDNFDTYWLTTRCRGDATDTVDGIAHAFSKESIKNLRKIQPTYWVQAKTEAIDFSKPFLWFDDDLFPDEKEILVEKNCLKSWIEVDLINDPYQLLNFSKNFPFSV